ncbi:MAG: HD domain-containing protein, partial [Desulfobacterales bacterium]|nr:HD domain-containing protein [Desulfobacterales bacterium]
PVVMVTALDDRESKIQAIEAGADDFITKPPQKEELLSRTNSLIKVKKLNNNLASIENVLFSLANAVEAKDTNTLGHIERVSNMAMTIGRRMKLSDKEIEALKIGGALHDVGKIGIPHDILNKSDKIEPDEWEIMKTHIAIGYKICQLLQNNFGPALDVICYHHEKLDGSGYPYGMMGEDIPMVARIMAVVDIYDALISNRPYRKGMSREEALKIIYEEADKNKLDKDIVRCLAELIYE